jgi:hypothetical protein
MKDDKKAEIRRHYGELLSVQRRLRALVATCGLRVTLQDEPAEPSTVDDLAEVMSVVRSNMHKLEIALNEWDHQVNGCETRTRSMIHADIDYDMSQLAKKEGASFSGRARGDVELNVAYDKMQLRRI